MVKLSFRPEVGALQYATITRPEVSFSMNKACQFLDQPMQSHWVAIKRIPRYHRGTIHLGLRFQSTNPMQPISITIFSDADWGSNPDDKKSTSESFIYLIPNLFSWCSKKNSHLQKNISTRQVSTCI